MRGSRSAEEMCCVTLLTLRRSSDCPTALAPLTGTTLLPWLTLMVYCWWLALGSHCPASWHRDWAGVQMTGEGMDATADNEAIPLGPADRPDMLDLVARTQPGRFFLPRSPELGTFLGLRRGGALVSMAGERLRPSGYAEITAVCTDEAWRGHGFATRLIRAVAAGMLARGDTPFLHATAVNTSAITLYKRLGFHLHRAAVFTAVRGPERRSRPLRVCRCPGGHRQGK